MTIAEGCLFASVMLYLLTIAVAKANGGKIFDNAKPRDPQFYASGLRARLLGAQQNGIESVPFFGLAVILAEFRGVHQGLVDGLALAFVLIRLAYVAAYAFDHPTLRSATWGLGLAVNMAIFFSPLITR